MTSPIYAYAATLRETFGLDPALYLARVSIERREDAALTDDDQAAITVALAPHKAPPSPAPVVPAPPSVVRSIDADMGGAFGLDAARFEVTVHVGRRDRQPLTDADAATIRAALARQSLAAE